VSSGEGVSSVQMKVVNAVTQETVVESTDSSGKFAFRNLRSGDYVLQFGGEKDFFPKTSYLVRVTPKASKSSVTLFLSDTSCGRMVRID
jgi:hypothetical protein